MFFATSPVFTLWAAPLSPFVIAAGRLIVATGFVWLLARRNRQPLLPRRSDGPLFVLIGLIAALHFICFIAAFSFTTIAQAVAITYTAPIFVTLFSVLFLKEPVSGRKWLGVIVAVAGIAIMTGLEPRMDRRMALGDLLALGAAVTYALYSIAGRSQRERYGLFTYSGTVYGIAALFALPAAALSFTPVGVTTRSWLAVFLAGPAAPGHGPHALQRGAAPDACDGRQPDRHPGGDGRGDPRHAVLQPDAAAERDRRHRGGADRHRVGVDLKAEVGVLMRLFCLSCEVLARPLYLSAARSPHIVDIELYRRGLHNDPADLRGKLQARIDALTGSQYDAIVMGYGLCGQATAGLVARDIPLVIPRAHDCITLFLGSREQYQYQFENFSGTYWYAHDYIERDDGSGGALSLGAGSDVQLNDVYDEYVRKYGKDNADYLMEVMGAWQKHYKRAAYIEMGIGDGSEVEAKAKAEAERRGWVFDRVAGDMVLIRRLVEGDWEERLPDRAAGRAGEDDVR